MQNEPKNKNTYLLKNGVDPVARHNARRYALQAMYQWYLSGTSMNEIELDFVASQIDRKLDLAYFQELIHGTSEQSAEIDTEMTPYLGRLLEEIDPIELVVLRLSVYELKNRLDIPYRVIINEALELTKKFGSVEGHKFVNGVLDKVARKLRKIEIPGK